MTTAPGSGERLGRFHAYLRDQWPVPRGARPCFTHNFGSDEHLVAILRPSTSFEGQLWSLPGGGVRAGEPDWTDWTVEMVEVGSLALVCEALESTMRTILEEQGLDPTSYC